MISHPKPTAVVLVVSDRIYGGERADNTTPLAVSMLEAVGFDIAFTAVVPEGDEAISRELDRAIEARVPFILTCGGTGLGPNNLTPEVTEARITTRLHGVEGTILAEGLKHSTRAGLSRGVVGLTSRERGGTLIVNAPSSKGGVEDCLGVVLALWPSIAEWIC